MRKVIFAGMCLAILILVACGPKPTTGMKFGASQSATSLTAQLADIRRQIGMSVSDTLSDTSLIYCIQIGNGTNDKAFRHMRLWNDSVGVVCGDSCFGWPVHPKAK